MELNQLVYQNGIKVSNFLMHTFSYELSLLYEVMMNMGAFQQSTWAYT